jgi:hypothetical protein
MLKIERTDAVMILTLDRPRARNALNLDLTRATLRSGRFLGVARLGQGAPHHLSNRED